MRPFHRQPIPFFISCTIILLQLCDITLANNAAELDWRKTTDAAQCRGRYEEPAINGGNTIQASANSAVHIEGESTTLKGNIVLTQENKELKADLLTIEPATEMYRAEGKTQLRQPGLLITGEGITGSLLTTQQSSKLQIFCSTKIRSEGQQRKSASQKTMN